MSTSILQHLPMQSFNHSLSSTDLLTRLAALKVDPSDLKLLSKNDVDGDCLPYLNDECLYRIGVPTLGRRVKIIKAAASILAEAAATSVLQGHRKSDKTGAVQPVASSKYDGKASTTPVKSESRPRTADTSNAPSPMKSKSQTLERPGTADKNQSSSKTPTRLSNTHANRSDDESDAHARKDRRSTRSDSDLSSDEDVSDVDSDSPPQSHHRSTSEQSKQDDDDSDDDLFGTKEAGQGSEFMAVKPWLGAIVPPSKAPKMDPTPPDQHLKLEWIHGYRAFDSRSNLVYNGNNEIVYPVAGTCVVYNQKTGKQRHFLGHNDDVRCLAQHPTKPNLMVSGQNATIVKGKGNPPYVCVWDSTDFTKVWTLKYTQEDRAISSVSFSGDGKLVITVSNDDNHSIKLWDWEKKACLATVKGDTNVIHQIRGNHRDATEFVSVGKRHAVFWNWDGSKLTGKKAQVSDRALSFYSVCFSEKGYACLGGEDGSIYVYVGGRPVKTFTGLHTGKVLSLDYYSGGIISGGADCVANILDKKMEVSQRIEFDSKLVSVHLNEATQSLLIGTGASEVFEITQFTRFEHAHIADSRVEPITTGHCDGELWALCASPDGRTFVTVGEDNIIAVWDVATHRCIRRSKITDKKGKRAKVSRASTTSTHPTNQCARAVTISPNSRHIAIGLNTGEMAVYDLKTLKMVTSVDLNSFGKRQVANQKENWIQAMSYSPNGRVLAVGTHGSVVALCDVSKDYKVGGLCKSSNSFISHLDWNIDGTVLQTNDGAYELLWYSVNDSDLNATKQITSASSVKDEKWASITCTLGWGVQGIYDSSQNGQQVNSVDVLMNQSVAVTGDDHGQVNLYRYPVPKGAKMTSSRAHSSHVVTTRFTSDGRYVLSTGGHDLAICQWAVVG